uniref:BTB domain-containing protein n=1 Tax=Rhabditophanes sp. KR3021 TaxID=114890 RepID=A0AC35TV50_9BILA
MSSCKNNENSIIKLNVGGTIFATSKTTLTWLPGTFFTSLLSGGIDSLKDSEGAIFIDRDPQLFRIILNYLRTRHLEIKNVDLGQLKHEAQYYNIKPLMKRLTLCQGLSERVCGDLLFHAMIPFSSEGTSTSKPLFVKKQNNSGINDSNMDNVNAANIIRGHHNYLAVGYTSFISIHRQNESIGWHKVLCINKMEYPITHLALNVKFGAQNSEKVVATVLQDNSVHLWSLIEEAGEFKIRKLGTFAMHVTVSKLFFIGNQLVALSKTGKVGIWHSISQNWQVQDIVPILCHDTAGSLLIFGGSNGIIYLIDMQKFPLRMKDNDLLVTELYKDPDGEAITAISVYLTSKTTLSGNWIEIGYGTSGGKVRVIVQHPETVGHGPQLFKTYAVHTNPITKVVMTTNHLISVCCESNHTRTWSIARFRGMISTQPSSTSLASFKILVLDAAEELANPEGVDIGPYGDQDGENVFVQKVVPDTCEIYIRLASTGDRICSIHSIDGSTFTSFFIHEIEPSNRMVLRPKRILFTGHSNGSIQMWDMTTALDQYNFNNTSNSQMSTALAQALVNGNEKSQSTNNTNPNKIDFDPYGILGITKDGSNLAIIRKAYMRKSLIYHPDKFKGSKEEGTKVFLKLKTAYVLLTDVETKKAYDDMIDAKERKEKMMKERSEKTSSMRNAFRNDLEEREANSMKNLEEMQKEAASKLEEKLKLFRQSGYKKEQEWKRMMEEELLNRANQPVREKTKEGENKKRYFKKAELDELLGNKKFGENILRDKELFIDISKPEFEGYENRLLTSILGSDWKAGIAEDCTIIED